MDSANQSKSNQSLPLPDDPTSSQPAKPDTPNLAAELIRQKVQAAYADEPDAATEALDLEEVGGTQPQSKHQKFLYDLTSSGKPLSEIQAGWHEYYAGLPDNEKHQVWQEFYGTHAQATGYGPVAASLSPAATAKDHPGNRTMNEARDSISRRVPATSKLKPTQHFRSLAFGLGVGSVVVLIFLFSFFNERFIAPFIQPSRNVTGTPIISSNSASGTNPEIIIPKINVEIPVVYGINTVEESNVQKALEGGVVHYADTAEPGQGGNVVIVGHSSNNIFNSGKYKFAFVLLSRMENSDIFYLEKDGKRYTYEVYEKKIVKPNEISVLGPQDKPATATLITCDPPGTSANRLVVLGRQISPDPSTNTAQVTPSTLATSANIVPGNAPSLWSRLFDILSR